MPTTICEHRFYSLFFSRIVGEGGLVYAVDLWEEGLRLLEEEIGSQNLTNILPLHADATDQIEIDDYSVDLCFMATVLHDFDEAKATDPVLKNIKRILKPNGCLVIIEFKKIDGPPGPPKSIRLSEAEVEQMVTKHGFRKNDGNNIGPYTYLMTFFSEP